MAHDTLSPETTFNDLCATLRRFQSVLPAAIAARFEAPAGMPSGSGHVPNPTLDTVVDPRRWALSSSVSKVALQLRLADVQLTKALEELDKALSAWEGQKVEQP